MQNGILTNTDLVNPTRSNTRRDDYFLTGLFPGQQVTLDYNSPDFDTFLQLVDAETGEVITFNDDGGPGLNSTLSFTAELGTDYIVRATSFGANATGNYTLNSSFGELIPGAPLAPGETISGTLNFQDPLDPNGSGTFTDDFFLTNILPGQEVTLSYTSNQFDNLIQVIDAETGEILAFDDDGGVGLDSLLTFTAEPGVDYIARARSFAPNQTGTYNLDVSTSFSIDESLSSSDLNNPTRPGRFHDDYALVGAEAGEAITLNLNGSFDTFLQLIDLNNGQVVGFNDDGGPGLNSQLTFTPVPGIEYGVRVTSFGSGAQGNYTITTDAGVLEEIAPSALLLNNPFTTGTFEAQTFDGSGNNLGASQLGRSDTALLDIAPLQYGDGFSTPSGEGRPNPRVISNRIAAQTEDTPEPRGLTNLIWAWGQFLDHDLSLTPENEEEPIDFSIPTGDPDLDPQGTGIQTIAINDSEIVEGTGTDPSNPRRLPNAITHWLDGSNVYGSDEERADFLRSFQGGRLRVSSGNLLPFGNDQIANDNPTGQDPTNLFAAGDVRANENAVLSSMHTLFVREHNRLADELSQAHPTWTDEQIFQRARQINIAQLQQITLNEYLPTLLGTDLPDYEGYNANIDPRIDRTFSTAAFRLGHTQLSSLIPRLTPDGDTIAEGNLTLAEVFFPGNSVVDEAGIDPILRGIASSLSQEVDNQLIDDVRNLLFGFGPDANRDLSAINIQRGRFNGIADYNTIRESFGLQAVSSFADITTDVSLQVDLEALYGSVDNIDAFVGFLAEDALPGSSLGETLSAILTDQFVRLRDGDRFYYENVLNGSEIAEIQDTTLSDIIRRNTDTTIIQDNAFTLVNEGTVASETLNGGLGEDVISGGAGDDVIVGHGADDTLRGDDGNDLLIGGDGSDTLLGGAGRDELIGVDVQEFAPGASEVDLLVGGGDRDRFILGDATQRFYDDTGVDDGFAIIADYVNGEDTIQLNGSRGDYTLGAANRVVSSTDVVAGTGIFFNGSDLIAIVEGQSTFAVNAGLVFA